MTLAGSPWITKIVSNSYWQFFRTLFVASRVLATVWTSLIVLRGLLPIALVLAIGQAVASVGNTEDLTRALIVVVTVFTATQVLASVHSQVGVNLGDRMSSFLQDQLLASTLSPSGLQHMESPDLADRLAVAQDFDLGRTGPPLDISIGIIAGGLVEFVIGLGQVGILVTYRWWVAIIVAVMWLSTHWFLREAMTDTRMNEQIQYRQRRAEYTYRLAVDAPAAKEVRLFNLSDWSVAQFAENSRRLVDLRWEEMRIRERPMLTTAVLLIGVNLGLFGLLAMDAADGAIDLGQVAVFAQAAVGAAALAFGGLNWALPPAAESVRLIGQLRDSMSKDGELKDGDISAEGHPAHHIEFNEVFFAYPSGSAPVMNGLNLKVKAGESVAIVGVNGAGKTTLVKLLCRLYDPNAGSVFVDGQDIREFEVASWRSRLAVVFQDFVRYDLSVRDNVAPHGASDELIWDCIRAAGASSVSNLDTILAKGYEGGTDLSGGQWQRIAIARALCAVRQGAELMILDEPTAQLDVRGELEIFDRILQLMKGKTTILVSHRFSTVRRVDRIYVVEHGRVIEQGSHDELMANDGRYREMFLLQASRFLAGEN